MYGYNFSVPVLQRDDSHKKTHITEAPISSYHFAHNLNTVYIKSFFAGFYTWTIIFCYLVRNIKHILLLVVKCCLNNKCKHNTLF